MVMLQEVLCLFSMKGYVEGERTDRLTEDGQALDYVAVCDEFVSVYLLLRQKEV